ncbi:MAG TPA: FhaA domain-containing protein [Candidatus Acidoferrales bacterium]|nr:FhaA domain-containing protein [Candidatus Acidoferrales bacterium]
MTGPLTALERFFERIFERPAARLFGTAVEPVQVRHRLERAMDAGDRAPGGFAPDRYHVRVNPADLGGLGDAVPAFADALVAHARNRGYRLRRRPTVTLSGDPDVALGDVAVEARLGGALARPGVEALHSAAGDPAGEPASGATMAFRIPVARVPYATLLVKSPGVAPRDYPVRDASVRIGRDQDNDLVLLDSRVSRRHGLLSARQGGLVYTDLGSTNGSFVNAGRVREVALGPGDVLRLGDSTVTIAQGR